MRYTGLEIGVLPFLVALATCQSWNSPEKTTTTEDYDNINLDPVLDETVVSARNDISLPETKAPEVIPCTTKKGDNGACVNYYLCDMDSETVIEDGYSIIDIREKGPCPNFLMVCCRLSQVLENKPSTEEDRVVLAAIASKSPATKLEINITETKCGWSNPGANVLRSLGFIDDNYADFGDFPWMVAVLKRAQSEDDWDSSNYIGGGSLIHPSVVMTVAHKLKKLTPEKVKIRAGEYETVSDQEMYDHQERDVSEIVIHPDYFRRSLFNDIALLFLEKPVTLENAPHIGVGCLGKELPPPKTYCYSMGWGAKDFNNKSIYAPILKKVKLPLVERSDCEEMLRKTRLGPFFYIHPSLTCAGGEAGIDTCKGDGGSSLVCPINDGGTRFAIFGMVAYGIDCGAANRPGVYVNIPNLYDWVKQEVNARGYDYNSYVY